MKSKGTLLRLVTMMAVLLAAVLVMAPPGSALTGIPSDATVLSATLHLQADSSTGPEEIRVHRVIAAWDEMTVTWNSFGGQYDPHVEAAFTSAVGEHYVDVAGLVQGWVSGIYPNYGLLLEQDLTGYTTFGSSENPFTDTPALEVCYSTPTIPYECATIQAEAPGIVADTYIWELYPDQNYGTAPGLYLGLISNKQKQVLLWFDLPCVPQGCTLTPGYWKTHSSYGPAPYDDTWAQIGEDTAFFLSGQSYYQVLWTSPRGNAYYILAHAYIAAGLNVLNGANMPDDVSAAWLEARALFEAYSPGEVGADKSLKSTFIPLAELLDAYNNGLVGPGHCAE